MSGITLIGLGVGTTEQLSEAAREELASAAEVWLRTSRHPAVRDLPKRTKIHAFDDASVRGGKAACSIDDIASRIVELGRRPEGVIYAVPGSPVGIEATSAAIRSGAVAEGMQVRVIPGQSLIEDAVERMGNGASGKLTLWDALTIAEANVPPFPPDVPALVLHLDNPDILRRVASVLAAVYPDDHKVVLLNAGRKALSASKVWPLKDLKGELEVDVLTVLHVPALVAGTSIESLQQVVARLRAPDGCPWDREQTHQSLSRHLLEEAYEAVAAMDSGDAEAMVEEFGDLLLQIILNAQIAVESSEFRLGDVTKGIHDKIIRRHPHVFGGLKVDGVGTVLANWEKLKEIERGEQQGKGGLLDGVPLALPALGQAQEYQERAARVGFDWPEVEGVLDKIAEEIDEVKNAADAEALTAEIGDLLFAIVNLARWKTIDAEAALRGANQRFRRRFGHIEAGAIQQGRKLSDLTLYEMETLWQEAKGSEPKR